MGLGLGLYKVENPMDRVSSLMGQSASSFAAMQKQTNSITKVKAPSPGVGGTVGAGLGGAAAGYELAGMFGGGSAAAGASAGGAAAGGATAGSSAGPWGAAIGAALAMGAYLFS
jgi:hypothetical protein